MDTNTSWSILVSMALTLGISHGFDLDHLAAIDAITRTVRGNRFLSKIVGFLFSLGHGIIVILISLIIGSGLMESHIPEWLDGFGQWVSIVFLLIFGVLNLYNVFQNILASVNLTSFRPRESPRGRTIENDPILKIWGRFRSFDPGAFTRSKRGQIDRGEYTSNHMMPVGIKSILVKKLSIKKYNPLIIMAIGALFAFSFDTFSQIALFSISGTLLSGWLFSGVLGIFFMLGMMISDGINGLLVSALIQRADGISLVISRSLGLTISLFSLGVGFTGLFEILRA